VNAPAITGDLPGPSGLGGTRKRSRDEIGCRQTETYTDIGLRQALDEMLADEDRRRRRRDAESDSE